MNLGHVGSEFLALRLQRTSPLANSESILPAPIEDIERELIEAHSEAVTDEDRRLLRDALMDLATFVPDETALLLNAGLGQRLRRLSPEQTELMRDAVNEIGSKQQLYLILVGDTETKPPLDGFLDKFLEHQRGNLMEMYGGIGTYAWIAGCLFKVVTANGLSTGLGGLAFFLGGMFVAGLASGIPFYLLHRGVVRVLPKDQIAWWLPWLGTGQRALQFVAVFIACGVIFDRIFGR